MAKITSIEYFRVLPRWLFVKVVDSDGNYGWGESTLEGHTEAIEGSLNELIIRFVGYEAEYVSLPLCVSGYYASDINLTLTAISNTSGRLLGDWDSIAVELYLCLLSLVLTLLYGI